MLFLLDTNAFSDLMREQPRVHSRLTSLSQQDRVITCTIVRGEVLHGIHQLAPGKKKRKLQSQADTLFAVAPSEVLPAVVADRYAQIKYACQRKGSPLDENDLWIAATALVLGATLVSRDRDFGRVDGLAVEDWTV